jgi:hypothetical protein
VSGRPGAVRDLIEAGLNEPAEARATLWVLCCYAGWGDRLETKEQLRIAIDAIDRPGSGIAIDTIIDILGRLAWRS